MTTRRTIHLALATLVFAMSNCSYAQSGWWNGFSRALAVQKGKVLKSNPKIGKEFKLLNADSANVVGDEIKAFGFVHATYNGYEIFADRLSGSRKSQVFVLEGHARLVGESETINGDSILINFATSEFSYDRGKAKLEPRRLENKATSSLYVKSDAGAGSDQDFTTADGSFTFCDKDDPHFELTYSTGRVLPGDRIELRKFGLKVFGAKVLSLPMLVIPLKERSAKYLPEFGQSVDEGYYMKNRFSIPIRGESYLDTRLDLMTQQGIGLGFDYNYRSRGLNGKLSAYHVSGGENSRVYSLQHEQQLGRGTLNLQSNYQLSDYLSAPGSTIWNANGIYQFPTGNGQSRLAYTRFYNSSSGFSSLNQVFGLSDDRKIGEINSRLDLSFNSAKTDILGGDSTKNERVDINYGANSNFRSFTADLAYQRSVPVGKTANFFSSSDVTPMLTLKTTAQQLFGNKIHSFLPFNLESSIGELVNPSSTGSEKVTRIFLDFGFRKSSQSGEKLKLDYGSRIKQGLYSDDTAQYVLNYDTNLEYLFARNSSIGINYGFLRGFGYTPLAIDSTGRNDSFSFDLNYSPVSTIRLSAQTGYDVYQSSISEVPWQFVWLRGQYKPGSWMDVTASASYDTFNLAWNNLRLDTALNFGRTNVNFGARYDGLRSQWAGFNMLVNGFQIGKVSTNFLVDYNGYTKQMDSQHYQFIYNLHCTEAVFEVIDNQVGFRSGRSYAFYIRIKALPNGSGFGQGTRGQTIGGGYGFGN